MLREQPFSNMVKILFLPAAVLILQGCGGTQKPVAPFFSLYGYERLAVIPFENATMDPGLPQALQEEITDEIVGLNALPVIDGAQVAVYLKSIKAAASDVPTDSALRQKIAQHFKCDILLVGSAAGYRESLKDTAPEHLPDPQTNELKWGFHTNRKVVVNIGAKLMEPNNGGLLWSQKGQGNAWFNSWNPLPIPDAVQVPDQLGQFVDLANLFRKRVLKVNDSEPNTISENDPNVLLYPKSSAFADLRQKAVFQSVNSIVGDFRGSAGWTPQAKGN